jgi:hypothetical protein
VADDPEGSSRLALFSHQAGSIRERLHQRMPVAEQLDGIEIIFVFFLTLNIGFDPGTSRLKDNQSSPTE